MPATERLALPLLAAAQAQKHVTHNEALLALDAAVQPSVLEVRAAPPGSPAEGDGYIVDTSPSGAWSGHAAALAVFQNSAWRFLTPRTGWTVWVAAEDAALIYDGSAWRDLKTRSADTLGINATADVANRLAVATSAALFTHVGAGTQVKLNKAAAGDTASLLFQTGFSGRAELGTAGDDKLHVKVSADGAAWHEALVIEASGKLLVGYGTPVNVGSAGAQATTVQVHGLDAGGAQAAIYRWANSNGGATISLAKSRGAAAGSRVAVQSGDILGTLQFYGDDGSNFPAAANIRAEVDATPGAADMPGRIVLSTTPDGAGAPVERLRITCNGDVGLGTTSPSCKLDVAGPVRLGQYAKAALPGAATVGAGALAYVSDEAGGAVIAFSDGTDWRRMTDRAVVS